MEPYGLKGPNAVYFTALYRYSEGLTSVKLGEVCSRDKSDVSRALALMEQKGLIEKETVGGNRYRALVRLTEDGKKVAREINEKAKQAVEIGGKGLSENDRAIFYRSLDLIAGNLRKLSEDGLI